MNGHEIIKSMSLIYRQKEKVLNVYDTMINIFVKHEISCCKLRPSRCSKSHPTDEKYFFTYCHS